MRAIAGLVLLAAIAFGCNSTTGSVAGATSQPLVCNGLEAPRCEEVRAVAAQALGPGAVAQRVSIDRVEPGSAVACATDGCTPVADVSFELVGGTRVDVLVVSVDGRLVAEPR